MEATKPKRGGGGVIYLLINHIPAYVGADAATLRLPQAWSRDLAAAGRSARLAGARLIVATPVSSGVSDADTIEIVPDELGFEHIRLPAYDSARSFLHERATLVTRLGDTIAAADIVQLDLGGHPLPLGLVADPLAQAAGKPTLWLVDGDRAPDIRIAGRSRSAMKRAVGRSMRARVQRTLSGALRNAAAVVTESSRASAGLAARFGVSATAIEHTEVVDAELASDATIAMRHARLLRAGPLTIAAPGELSIDRGVDHVLAAMHRCWRLRVPVTLMLERRGDEIDTVRRRADELGLTSAVHFVDSIDLTQIDLVVDASLINPARLDLDRHVAAGVPAIAYAARHPSPGVEAIARGAVDVLAESLFRAATDRAGLAAKMIAGHAWVRARTVDASHRARFALAADIVARRSRGAA